MKIKFTDMYNATFASVISKKAVERTVRDPDKVKSTGTGKSSSSVLRSKLLDDGERGPHFTVVASIDDGETISVSGGFRIPHDISPEAASFSPSQLLKALASRVGLEIRVGDTRETFVEHAEVPVDRPDVRDVLRTLEIPKDPRPGPQPTLVFGGLVFTRRGQQIVAELNNFVAIDRLKYLRFTNEKFGPN